MNKICDFTNFHDLDDFPCFEMILRFHGHPSIRSSYRGERLFDSSVIGAFRWQRKCKYAQKFNPTTQRRHEVETWQIMALHKTRRILIRTGQKLHHHDWGLDCHNWRGQRQKAQKYIRTTFPLHPLKREKWLAALQNLGTRSMNLGRHASQYALWSPPFGNASQS